MGHYMPLSNSFTCKILFISFNARTFAFIVTISKDNVEIFVQHDRAKGGRGCPQATTHFHF